MGAKQQTYATIRQALAIIANTRLSAASGVADPDRYHARILADLRTSLHDKALEILETATEPIDAETLAAMLEPSSKPKWADTPNPSAALPVYEATSWTPLPLEEQEAAKNRIAEIRAKIADTTKAEGATP